MIHSSADNVRVLSPLTDEQSNVNNKSTILKIAYTSFTFEDADVGLECCFRLAQGIQFNCLPVYVSTSYLLLPNLFLLKRKGVLF